jgi:hypothetical protein
MEKKLNPIIEFEFLEQEELPEFNIDVNIETNSNINHITIIEHKKNNKHIDVSTKLF